MDASCEFIVCRVVPNLQSNLTKIEHHFLFPIGSSSHTLSVLRLELRFRNCQNIRYGDRSLWFDLKSGLFWPILAQTLLCNSTNIDNQLLFCIGSPNRTLSTFLGGVGDSGGWGWWYENVLLKKTLSPTWT